jgi:hypothetical protein
VWTPSARVSSSASFRAAADFVDRFTGAFLPFGIDFVIETIRCIHSSGFAMAQADE